jgi:RNA-splicing ligase RtcB
MDAALDRYGIELPDRQLSCSPASAPEGQSYLAAMSAAANFAWANWHAIGHGVREGTASFVLAGRPGSMERSFGTVCHGAGRALSRTQARKRIGGAELRRRLEQVGITVRCRSDKGLVEEAPFAYNDVEKVVAVVERAGLAVRVARLLPLGVVKG